MNTQKPVKLLDVYKDNGNLLVHSIFHTIQGEGMYSGKPAVFVRLYGCNLQCPLCDTDYTSQKLEYTPNELVKKINSLIGSSKLVVITGGEPLLQNLNPVITKLFDAGYTVQLETNGTVYNDALDYTKCDIVCSPKTPVVDRRLLGHISHYKYLVDSEVTLSDVGTPTEVLGLKFRKSAFVPNPEDIIYIQPVDVGDVGDNGNNMDRAISICMEHGHTLCVQMHKIIGVE